MSSTHAALYYHFVWGTKNQEPIINRAWRERLHAYLGGCAKNAGIPVAVGGVSDHVHMLVSLDPTYQLSEFARDVKRKSSEWIHTEIGIAGFHWQDGYGVFTVSKSAVEEVRAYIAGQEEHHRTRSFREEYVAFLKKHGVDYDERYIWRAHAFSGTPAGVRHFSCARTGGGTPGYVPSALRAVISSAR